MKLNIRHGGVTSEYHGPLTSFRQFPPYLHFYHYHSIHYYTTTMPPKRPSKRRGDEEDNRPSKKGGKKNKEPTYDTYDECLDGESSRPILAGC